MRSRTEENVTAVIELVLSQENQLQIYRPTRQMIAEVIFSATWFQVMKERQLLNNWLEQTAI